MDRTPVYRYPVDYAEEHEELKQYGASNKANKACRNVIEEAVDRYYTGNRFDAKSAVREVMKQFGCERVLYILAVTVRHKAHDGRISRSNKEWARTVKVFENPDSYGRDLNAWIVVDRCHPVLTDSFITAARQEHLLSLPLTAAEIKSEALEIQCKLRDIQEPNSPKGTHFMAQISPDFIARAKTRDLERLAAILSFPSLEVQAITGRKGVYAVISREEDRFRKLQK